MHLQTPFIQEMERDSLIQFHQSSYHQRQIDGKLNHPDFIERESQDAWERPCLGQWDLSSVITAYEHNVD